MDATAEIKSAVCVTRFLSKAVKTFTSSKLNRPLIEPTWTPRDDGVSTPVSCRVAQDMHEAVSQLSFYRNIVILRVGQRNTTVIVIVINVSSMLTGDSLQYTVL